MVEEPRQFWVRNDKGKVWGPLTFATIELFVANRLIDGRLQASRDGLNFVFPGRLPELRDAFPRDHWGSVDQELPEEGSSSAGTVMPVLTPSARPPGAPLSTRPPPASSRPAPAPQAPPVLSGERPAPIAAPPVLAGPSPTAKVPPIPPTATPLPRAAPPTVGPPRPAPAPAPAPGAVPASGDLALLSPFYLYYRIAAQGSTGRLALTSGETGYELFFKKGSPEAVRPSRAEEDLGSFLVERGGLSAAALDDARKVATDQGGDVVAGLFLLQLINPATAFTSIRDHALGLLRRALSLPSGSFCFDPGAAFPGNAMPLGDRWALVCDAARVLPALEIKSRLGEHFEQPIMKSGGRVELTQLRLTPQEARAAATFDGVHSVAELIGEMPGEAEALARTAFLMASFEMVSFAQVAPRAPQHAPPPRPAPEPAQAAPKAPARSLPEPARAAPAAPLRPPPVLAGPARPPPSAPPRPPPVLTGPAGAPARAPTTAARSPPVIGAPAGPPAGATATPRAATARPPAAAGARPAGLAAEAANDPARLRELVGSLRQKTHFEVLELTPSALGPQVKAAYFALAKLHHPDTAQVGTSPEVARLKADLFGAINEAYRILADDKSRAAYLAELKAGGSQEPVDVAAIFAAEEAFQKGCILVRARKYAEALVALDEAVRLNDKEGEFFAWRGWAAYLAAADKAAARRTALKEIELALKLNPKCAQAYYFGGQVLKLSGDSAGALKWFKKTLQLDERHVDAMREVRAAGSR